jgi:predicted nucleic acid-binding protein
MTVWGGARQADSGSAFFGVVGLLKLAKDQGLIDQLRPELQSLLSVGYHLSSNLIAEALDKAGELQTLK